MRLAKGLPFKNGAGDGPDAGDPREDETAEIIDLASRNGYSFWRLELVILGLRLVWLPL